MPGAPAQLAPLVASRGEIKLPLKMSLSLAPPSLSLVVLVYGYTGGMLQAARTATASNSPLLFKVISVFGELPSSLPRLFLAARARAVLRESDC